MAVKKTASVDGSKSKLQEAMDKLNKSYGQGTILTLDDQSTGEYDVFSTGSIAFDHIALGTGGFVEGRVYELMGWEGTGKSTICGHAAAECQKKGGVVAYIDAEHAVDKHYFEALGVDTTKMLIAQPNSGEEGFQIALDLIKTGEIKLIILDSDSSLMPKKVVDGEVGDSAIGKKAVLNNSVYPKLKNACSFHNVCMIVISQFREKIGVMFGNPTTTQGGHALKFYSDVRIEVSKSLFKDGDDVIGNVTKIKVVKNKMSAPYKLCSFDIIYGLGIDKGKEIMELLNTLELGRKYGQTFTFKEIKYPLDTFMDMLSEEDFNNEVTKAIIEKIKSKPLIEDESKNQEVSA